MTPKTDDSDSASQPEDWKTPDNSILKVIDQQYCIGCGICAVPEDSPFEMFLNEDRMLQARVAPGRELPQDLTAFSEICPFGDTAANETEIADAVYRDLPRKHPIDGRYLANYAGYVCEDGYRDGGSSGGFGSWVQRELLAKGHVDYLVNVAATSDRGENGLLFSYRIVSSVAEVREGAKSKYYPIELSGVLKRIKESEGRYAVVGVPCFIKALRLLAAKDAIIKDRIHFYIGLVCGHLKSTRFAESFAWEMGIPPRHLQSFDFRKKLDDRPASEYAVEATGATTDGTIVTRSQPTRELVGHNWGHGFFKYKACDYCDDVLAEAADITIGDAWLPEYKKDPKGTNILVTRNATMQALLDDARTEGRIAIQEISADRAAASQDAGKRHKIDGLKYRLYLRDQNSEWRPKKRLQPSARHMPKAEREKTRVREEIREESHRAFRTAIERDDFRYFAQTMAQAVSRLPAPRKASLARRIARRLKRMVKEQLLRR